MTLTPKSISILAVAAVIVALVAVVITALVKGQNVTNVAAIVGLITVLITSLGTLVNGAIAAQKAVVAAEDARKAAYLANQVHDVVVNGKVPQ